LDWLFIHSYFLNYWVRPAAPMRPDISNHRVGGSGMGGMGGMGGM
jgi:hypothetical protein